jgi:hypothetical protein
VKPRIIHAGPIMSRRQQRARARRPLMLGVLSLLALAISTFLVLADIAAIAVRALFSLFN